METSKKKNIYKVLLLGDSSVGKTSIILMHTKGVINKNYITTIGFDFAISNETLKNGSKITLQIWDTAGQERFHSITNNLYKSSQGLILVYDITSLESFQSINHWLETIKSEKKDEKIKILLVGNKKDKINERQVSFNNGKNLAESYGVDFYEVSALENNGINIIFHQIAKKLSGLDKDNNNSLILDRNSHTNKSIKENQKSCCLFKILK